MRPEQFLYEQIHGHFRRVMLEASDWQLLMDGHPSVNNHPLWPAVRQETERIADEARTAYNLERILANSGSEDGGRTVYRSRWYGSVELRKYYKEGSIEVLRWRKKDLLSRAAYIRLGLRHPRMPIGDRDFLRVCFLAEGFHKTVRSLLDGYTALLKKNYQYHFGKGHVFHAALRGMEHRLRWGYVAYDPRSRRDTVRILRGIEPLELDITDPWVSTPVRPPEVLPDGPCPICYEDYDTARGPVRLRRCGHVFHAVGCLEVWMNSAGRDTCPMCRDYIVMARRLRPVWRPLDQFLMLRIEIWERCHLLAEIFGSLVELSLLFQELNEMEGIDLDTLDTHEAASDVDAPREGDAISEFVHLTALVEEPTGDDANTPDPELSLPISQGSVRAQDAVDALNNRELIQRRAEEEYDPQAAEMRHVCGRNSILPWLSLLPMFEAAPEFHARMSRVFGEIRRCQERRCRRVCPAAVRGD